MNTALTLPPATAEIVPRFVTTPAESGTTIRLKNGRSVTREVEEFNGTPARPLSQAELKDKFMTLTRTRYGAAAEPIFDRLQGLENETDMPLPHAGARQVALNAGPVHFRKRREE